MLSIVASWAHDVVIDGIYYNLDETNKTAEVTYGGINSTEFSNEYIGSYEIPSTITYNSEIYTVTSIGEYAFHNCDYLMSVKIPNTVTSIGKGAFYGCISLYTSNSVDKGENDGNDENLGYLQIPIVPAPSQDKTTLLFHINGVECDDFELYLMGIDGVWEDTPEMKFERLQGNNGWFIITVPAMDESQSHFNIRANGSWIYESKAGYELLKGTHNFVKGSSIETLGIYKNAAGQILYFHVNEFVTPCGESETRSAVVNEDENSEEIDYFIIPNSVKYIGESAFYNCTSLKKVNYLGTVDEWVDIDFEEESQLPYNHSNPTYYAKDLYINGELLTDVKITSADSINDIAFYNCESIKSVELGKNVKSIGSNAFDGCDNLSKVNYLGSVDEWVDIDHDSDLLIYAEDLYINDELLTDVVITSADSIKKYAFFNCKSIKTVELGSSVKYIGDMAFAYCNGITSLSIGENVQYVEYAAFYDCSTLKNVTAYPRVVPNTGQVNYADSIFGTYIAYLNVPCESLEAYELDNVFGQFKYIRCIEEKEEAPEDVEIEVDDNGNVNIKWPPTEGANSYKLVVSHAGNVICTLQFNSMGQLTSIDLGTRSASVGFEFTVTGLTQGSKYSYEMTALSASEEVLEYYAGAFITNGYEEGDDDVTTSVDEAMSDVIISASSGLITCSEANILIYNVSGQNVTAQNGALTSGVYMVQVGDAYVKVMMK